MFIKTHFRNIQKLKFAELKHDWSVGELNQLYVISHTFLGITHDEFHMQRLNVLGNFMISPFFSLF